MKILKIDSVGNCLWIVNPSPLGMNSKRGKGCVRVCVVLGSGQTLSEMAGLHVQHPAPRVISNRKFYLRQRNETPEVLVISVI